MRFLPVLLLLVGCLAGHEPEDPSGWFDPGAAYGVVEPVEFTDTPYAFPASDADGIAALLADVFDPLAEIDGPPGADVFAYGADDQYPDSSDCSSIADDDLPFEVEGVVTIHPRFYFKTSGCTWDSDEKFYGSFFVQDRTGGVFVLGNTKVAHFDVGDRVRLRIRGVKTSFDLNMVYTYDLVEIVERDGPVYYTEATEALGADDVGTVHRVTGEVVQAKDTFGEFRIESDEGVSYTIGLDVELNRRGVDYPLGTRLTVTGPVLYSYSAYSVVVMNKGQVVVHEDATENDR